MNWWKKASTNILTKNSSSASWKKNGKKCNKNNYYTKKEINGIQANLKNK